MCLRPLASDLTPHSFILKPADTKVDRVNKRLIQVIDLGVPTLGIPLLVALACHAYIRRMVVGIHLLPRRALPRDPSYNRTLDWLKKDTDVAISDPLTRFTLLPRSVRGPVVVPFNRIGIVNAISETAQPYHTAAQREIVATPYSRTSLAIRGTRGRYFCMRAPEAWTQLELIEQALTEQSGWLYPAKPKPRKPSPISGV